MLINDAKYFKPQVMTALFRANEIIAHSESVKQLNLISSKKANGCQLYIFSVVYKDFRTQRQAPDYLQLKIGTADATQARREVDFYARLYRSMARRSPKAQLHLPKAYDAYIDDDTGQFHLVLEGASPEFSPAKNKMPPTSRHRDHLIDTLATLHAYWWDHPLLGELQAQQTDAMLNQRLEQLQNKFNTLKKSVGSYLDTKHLSILEKVATGIPEKRKTRLLSGQGLTIIHGNLVPQNILYSTRDTMIVNWEHWQVGFGADDLAIMIPINWTDDLRQFQELPLLKRYYSNLTKQHVTNYSWDDLEYDYRTSLAHIISNLLLQWTLDEHTRGHWRRMEQAIVSFIKLEGDMIFD